MPQDSPTGNAPYTLQQARLEVSLLGTPGIYWQAQELHPASQKDRALVYYLAAHPEGVTRDELAQLLWPGSRNSSGNLRQALHVLRKLEAADVWLEQSDQEQVKVRAECDWLKFQQHMDQGDVLAALAVCRASQVPKACSRGAFLWGFELKKAPAFMDWLEVERARLETLYAEALLKGALTLEDQGRTAEAIELVEELLREDQLNESAYRLLMRLRYQRGELDLALAAFERCRRMLVEELSVEPLEETCELAHHIEQRHALQLSSGNVLPAQPRIPRELLRPPHLIGREALWARMDAAWQAGQAIFISGAAGMGKTRLMLDFARSKGSYLLTEGHAEDRTIPYSSAARALRRALDNLPELALADWVQCELARLVPDKFPQIDPPPLPDSLSGGQFQQGVLLAFGEMARHTSAFLADDVHFYDPSSRQLGVLITSHIPQAERWPEVGLISTFRSEHIDETYRAMVSAMVEANEAIWLELTPFTEEDITALLQSLEVPQPQQLAPALAEQTGGVPALVIEALKVLYGHGDVSPAALRSADITSSLMQRRLRTISPRALRLVRLFAVSQPEPAPEMLQDLLGVDEVSFEVALEELERTQLIADFQFVHDLIYQEVLELTPSSVRTTLHRRVGRYLETHQGIPARVARHYLQAGDSEHAAPHLLAAAKEAAALYTVGEAKCRFFQLLWATQQPDLRREALLELEVLSGRSGDLDLQRACLDALESLVFELQDDGLLHDVLLRRSNARLRTGALDEAEALIAQAGSVAERLGEPLRRAQVSHLRGTLAFYRGDLSAAQDCFREVLAQGSGDDPLRLRALSNLGSVAGLTGDLDCAYRYQGQALTLARKLGQMPQIASLLNNVGATAERLARYDEATQSFQEASALYAKSADTHGQVTVLTNLAEVALRQGRYHYGWQVLQQAKPLAEVSAQPLLMSFVRRLEGTLAWRLGRAEAAAQHVADALAQAERAGDKRAVAIARYNLARCHLSLGDNARQAELEEALADVAALGLQDVLVWAQAELALMAQTPEGIRHWLEQPAPQAASHPHVALCQMLAEQRARLIEHPEGASTDELEAALGTLAVAESPLGYLLVAASCWPREARKAASARARALALLTAQLSGLPLRQRAGLDDLVRVWPGLEGLLREQLARLQMTRAEN